MNETPAPSDPAPGAAPRAESRFEFRRVNEITGTFVLGVLVLLIAAVVWTGRSQRWFKSRVPLQIVLPADGAAGIRQGSEVYFLGTLVGSVADVIVDETGRMEADARIRRDFFRFVRADSSAVVKKKFGVAGDAYFEITRGVGQPLPEKHASIVCNEQFQSALEAAVDEIRAEAVLVLKTFKIGLETWTTLGTHLITTRERLDQFAIRLESLAAGIEAGTGTVGRLLTDPTLADDAQNLLARANEGMSELRGVVTNLDGAAKNIQASTVRLPEITGAVADEAKDLPGLLQQTQASMRELERLITAMQRHWLVRKHVDQANPPPTRPQFQSVPPEKKPQPVLRSPRDPTR